MKRRNFVLVIVCTVCLLMGCSSSSDNEIVDTTVFSYDTYRVGYDAPMFFTQTFGMFTKAEGGYYYWDKSQRYAQEITGSVTYLMYFDAETKVSVPVCSKADCKHEANGDCDAVFGSIYNPEFSMQPNYLWYYDGNLYTMISNHENNIQSRYIYQISPDGSTRTRYLKLYDGNGGFNVFHHRGYIYAAFSVEKDRTVLYRVELKKDAEPEKIYEFNGVGSMFTEFSAYDTGVAFSNIYYTDETYEDLVETIEYYNPVTGQIKTLANNLFLNAYIIIDDYIYYCQDGKIFTYNINTGEETLFYTCDKNVYLSYDGNYLYAEVCSVSLEDYSEHYIYVLDLEGNLIDSIQAASYQDCYFGDNKYLFQMFDLNEGLTGKSEKPVMKVFDKSQIGTGKHEWIELPIPEK